eukprot:scaffold1535_cov382-Prasinococcus_capsulatus_cf.AAC.2
MRPVSDARRESLPRMRGVLCAATHGGTQHRSAARHHLILGWQTVRADDGRGGRRRGRTRPLQTSPRSRRKPRTSSRPATSREEASLAHTSSRSAMGALVIHALVPLST